MSPALEPETVDQVGECIRAHGKILPMGGHTKEAMSSPWDDDITTLRMNRLNGVVEYEPTEFTITVRSGTALRDINSALAEHGQYLPFDPPWVDQGATIGGTVAAGLSGPGRVRYGGVRDFILGVELFDGTGALVRGGGKVVKNAAGFDLPKLMVGSGGRLGVMTELTFKAFPVAEQHLTIIGHFDSLECAVRALYRLLAEPFDIDAIEIEPSGLTMIRLAGDAAALDAHAGRIVERLECANERVQGAAESSIWSRARRFEWVAEGRSLIKIPITPSMIGTVSSFVSKDGAACRYSAAGNVCWLTWPGDHAQLEQLDRKLSELKLRGLVLKGAPCPHLLGNTGDNVFAQRLKQALDAQNRFGDLM